MAYKHSTDRFSFDIATALKWIGMASLVLNLLLGANAQQLHANASAQPWVQMQLATAQEQNPVAAAQRKMGEGRALEAQGTAESLRMSVKKYEEALLLWQVAGDRAEEADALSKIGLVYHLLGDMRKALDFYNRVLPLWRAVGDRNSEAATLSNIGSLYSLLGENQKALSFLDQALQLVRTVGNRAGEAATLNAIGRVYGSFDENQKALDFLNQSLLLWHSIGDRAREADTLHNIGAIYAFLDENQKALDFYNQALLLKRAIGDLRGEANALSNIGWVYYNNFGENQKALDFFNQALPLLRAVGNRRGEALTLINIGDVYTKLGEKQKALVSYDQALPLIRAVGEPSGEASTFNGLGGVYFSLGETQKALDFFSKALLLTRAVGDRIRQAATLSNIGKVYYSLGENQKALDSYNQALSLQREIGNRRGEAATLKNISSVHYSLGEMQQALGFLNRALALQREVGDREGEGETLNNIGAVYYSLGESQKALNFFNQALLLLRAVGSYSGEASALNGIGVAHDTLGEGQKALDFYNQALVMQRKAAGDRSDEAQTLSNIAYAERDLGRFDESRSHIESSIKIIELLRTKVVSQELRASFFATKQGKYEFYIDLLMRMHKQEPTRSHDAKALQASEQSHARSLLESLAEARANIRQGVDPALLARERTVQQQLNAKAEAQFKLPTNAEAQLAALNRGIDALTTELQRVQTQIRQASPRYAALTQPQPLNAAEIQQQVLDAETLLLEYALGAERSFVWAVTPTGLTSCELPKREVIEAAARQVYELMTARNKDEANETREQKQARVAAADRAYPAAAARLSQMLLAPVAQHLGKKRLVIVADGALHYLPFGALPIPKDEGGGMKDEKKNFIPHPSSFIPLIAEHEVVNLPSASTLAVLRRELKGRAPAAKTLAVIADPVFTRADERFRAGAAPVAKVTAKAEPTLRELANAQVVRKLIPAASGDLDIKRLKYSRDEANALLALTSAREALQALDFDATRALVESDRLSQYRYVHFATHGLADSERAELSTIVLSLFDAQGRPVDGFLRAHEVYNLNLLAELVVLSACETGLGKLTKGEGLVSLTRGFMYAGAARVVVSLWAVNDRATAELMTSFYRKMLNEGQRPAAALRAAQIEMWRTPQWTAPYYWAAFTLQGEWR